MVRGHSIEEYPPAPSRRGIATECEITLCPMGDSCDNIRECDNEHPCKAGLECEDMACIYDHPGQPERQYAGYYYCRDAWARECADKTIAEWRECPTRDQVQAEKEAKRAAMAAKKSPSASITTTFKAASKRKRGSVGQFSGMSQNQMVTEIMKLGQTAAYDIAQEILKQCHPRNQLESYQQEVNRFMKKLGKTTFD